jgi:hypothetical protein
MSALTGTAYAQVRIQSRYGQRADTSVWLKLHNIQDLGSYLQTAQQSALRPWVLGLSATHSSHDIELALRQKYRQHVDEVAGWMPIRWQQPVRWIKRLVDLPALQYLLTGGEPLEWMKSDPCISEFTADDPQSRAQAMIEAGNKAMVDALQQDGSILSGWLSQWHRIRPRSMNLNHGLRALDKLIHEYAQRQANQHGRVLPTDYDQLLDQLRLLFRRYAFQPTAVVAYLVIVAVDVYRIRSDLMQRLFFQSGQDLAEGLPE